MPEEMDKHQLNALLSELSNESVGYAGSELSTQRADAMKFYLGEPFGNEAEGKSSYVSRDVQDTVEWIMPNLMEIFASGDRTVTFDAQGPEDVAAAEQETEYINYLFERKVDGFKILHNWFKDALIQKTGFVKHYWDDSVKETRETYENLSEQELEMLLTNPDVELVEQTVSEEESIDPNTGMPTTIVTIEEAVVIRTEKAGKLVIENIPPEEITISRRAKSIKDADFIRHQPSDVTVSDLRDMGISEKKIKQVIEASTQSMADLETSPEHLARFSADNTDPVNLGIERKDEAMMRVRLEEFYIRVDYDGDGIAELRQIIRAGKVHLVNEEIDEIPITSICPILMPHKFYGRSVADLVMDIQELKSNLMRSMLDNINLHNNGKYAVIDGMVNLDDLLTSRPLGIVRQKVQGAVSRLDTPSLPPEAFQMLGYVDHVREERTGVSKISQGLDDKALGSNTASMAVTQVMSAAQQRVQMIARVFAETGVRDLFRAIHKLVLQNEDQRKIFRLRGEFQEVDPSQWKERYDMAVSVGLGNGNKDQKLIHLTSITQDLAMFQNMGMPVATPGNAFNLMREKLKNMGYKNTESFLTDVSQIPPPPQEEQGPSPEEQKMQLEIADLQRKQQKDQMEMQIKQQELEVKGAEAQARIEDIAFQKQIREAELQLKLADLRLKEQELMLEKEQGRAVKIG
tara:strand:- start:860 stop:2923 length:2064 start_codon:yes stop_codon:yes gene_type:complete